MNVEATRVFYGIKRPHSALFDLLTPPTTNMKKLHAKDEFVVGKNNIAWINSTFKEHLYDLDFTPSTFNLARRTLEKPMNDVEILTSLKPEAVLLGDVLYALEYLEHDDWYLFYVNDRKGALWAVRARWNAVSGGWLVYAYSVERPLRWYDGRQVLSRGFSDPLPSGETFSPFDSLPDILTINNIQYKRI